MKDELWMLDKKLWAALISRRDSFYEMAAINTRDAALKDGLSLCNFTFNELWFEYTYPNGRNCKSFEIEPEIPNEKRADGFLLFCPENQRWYVGYDFWLKDHGSCTGPAVPCSPSFLDRRDAEEWCKEQWCKFIGKKYEKAIQLDLFGGDYS